jgi:hypothetical protein
MQKTISGLFESVERARGTIEALVTAGVPRRDISAVVQDPHPPSDGQEDHEKAHPKPHLLVKDTEKGAFVGGLAGLLLEVSALTVPVIGPVVIGGWLTAAVIGAGVGAVIGALGGSIAEGLATAGLPRTTASRYEAGIHQGAVLLAVRAEEPDIDSIVAVFQQHGAADIHAEGMRGDKVTG